MSQTVTLTCGDGAGSGCDKTYYSTDGSVPTTSSSGYANPLLITSNTTLKFFSTDRAGNMEGVERRVAISCRHFHTTPTFASLDPNNHSSSVGVPVNFSLTVGDGDGWEDLKEIRFVMKEGTGTGTTADGIIVWWTKTYPNRINLWDHAQRRWVFANFGSAAILENTNGSLDVSRSGIAGNGDILTLNLSIIPKTAFVQAPLTGNKRIWLLARDLAGNTLNNLQIGTWRVVAGSLYNLTLGVNPGGGGTTSPAAGGPYSYSEGTEVALSATANSGYRFVNWTGDLAGVVDPTLPSITVTMNANRDITANFVAVPTYNLTMAVSPGGGGTTTPAAGGPYSYAEGTAVVLSATANSGYRFVNWTGDLAGVVDPTLPSITVTMNANRDITANFVAVPTYNLTMAVSPGGGGTTTPAAGGPYSYAEGTAVVLSATANSGYRFVNWTGDLAGVVDPTLPSITVTMNANRDITANFVAVPTYNLTMAVSPGGGGTTTPAAGGPYSYAEGTAVVLSATANSGYRFVNWTGDLAGVPDVTLTSITVTMNSNRAITANFEATGLGPLPTFISLTPSSHTSSVGVPVDFTLSVGDGNGWQDLKEIRFVVKEGTGGGTTADAIVVWWTKTYPNRIYLWDHAQSRWVFANFGSAAILENTNGSLDVSRCSITGNGDILTLNLSIIPKTAFVQAPLTGNKRIWLLARDLAGNTLNNLENRFVEGKPLNDKGQGIFHVAENGRGQGSNRGIRMSGFARDTNTEPAISGIGRLVNRTLA